MPRLVATFFRTPLDFSSVFFSIIAQSLRGGGVKVAFDYFLSPGFFQFEPDRGRATSSPLFVAASPRGPNFRGSPYASFCFSLFSTTPPRIFHTRGALHWLSLKRALLRLSSLSGCPLPPPRTFLFFFRHFIETQLLKSPSQFLSHLDDPLIHLPQSFCLSSPRF